MRPVQATVCDEKPTQQNPASLLITMNDKATNMDAFRSQQHIC